MINEIIDIGCGAKVILDLNSRPVASLPSRETSNAELDVAQVEGGC